MEARYKTAQAQLSQAQAQADAPPWSSTPWGAPGTGWWRSAGPWATWPNLADLLTQMTPGPPGGGEERRIPQPPTPGMAVGLSVPAAGCEGKVVPRKSSHQRPKAAPSKCAPKAGRPGLIPGMFARLTIPLGKPGYLDSQAAVRQVAASHGGSAVAGRPRLQLLQLGRQGAIRWKCCPVCALETDCLSPGTLTYLCRTVRPLAVQLKCRAGFFSLKNGGRSFHPTRLLPLSSS
jgi:hypothetical protein